MITGDELIDATQVQVEVVANVGLEQFLRDRGVEEDALRAVVRFHASDIVEGSGDVHGVIVQAVILGYLAGQATALLKEIAA